MKKLFAFIVCLFCLTGCADGLSAGDLKGAWENSDGDRIYFGSDGKYEIKYANAEIGGIDSESGSFELNGGKILFSRRDKYTLTEIGEIKFERLIHTEDRKEKISLSEEGLEINGTTYIKREE